MKIRPSSRRSTVVSLYEIPLTTIDGKPATLAEHSGEVMLAVNVASKCGFTPQYTALQALQQTYADRGFTVLGFPCNQFLFQENGSEEQIATFCSATYGVSFPMFAKLKVRGRGQHPLYAELTKTEDVNGKAGGVKWNFEKFLINRDGEVVGRFRSKTTPDDPAVLSAIESALG
ncbi:MAG TPA: glutathione peroxidase [Mycobacteriales bacterium]|jgi:glutathione peroxidase|nr:glutathione peroxidase [Mycobacteriales bacterium]